MGLNFKMFAGIGGPTNKLIRLVIRCRLPSYYFYYHSLLCPSFLGRDIARSTFLHLHFHSIPEPFFQYRSTSLTNDNRRRCVMFLIVIRSNYRLKLFAAINTNFTFSCLVCFPRQSLSAVIRRRPDYQLFTPVSFEHLIVLYSSLLMVKLDNFSYKMQTIPPIF